MRLAAGTRLGNYEIVSLIGAGGMGEVYRAHDTVLHRHVALKIVHPDICHHPDSRVRLRREARALAALHHPNIATIHELAEFDDGCGIVMELVSGDTLADRLRGRRLPLDEVIRLALQIAAALEAAHDVGVVHRDLKPANVKVTSSGDVKILDFGLATADGEQADVHGTTAVTAPGVLVGTVPYMSPEQARGTAVDRRTDIWAFGCVLFEMLSGRLAFDGGSRTDILAAILDKDPEWAALPDETPSSLRRLVKRCLHKDVRRRLRHMGDARLELEDAAAAEHSGPMAVVTPATPRRHLGRAAALLVVGAAIGGLAVAAWRPSTSPVAASEVRFTIALLDDGMAATQLGALALSPDGRTIVYVGTRGETTHLLLRPLDSARATPIPGTAGATSPFFSPDGQWIAFFAEGRLKKISMRGGSPVPLCEAPDGLGGSWSATGRIVFASATGAPLQQVSADGGAPARVTTLDVSRGEFSHRWPEFLPDGDTVLFTVGTVGEWDDAEIDAQSISTGRRTSILNGGTNPRYLSTGHLAYAHDGAIWVRAFDASRLALTGPPAAVIDRVNTSVDGAAQFSVSRTGAAVYQPSAPFATRRLIVADRSGPTPIAAPPHAYVSPRVAPDGRRVLLGVADEAEHVWSYDLAEGTLAPLTFEASNRTPIWSANGKMVTFASNRNGAMNLFTVPAGGDGPTERLTVSDALQLPGSWSPDGQVLAFVEHHPVTGRDIWLLRPNGERTPWAHGNVDESAPRFSPDGTRIAYVSNESGQAEVYVRALAGSAPVQRVSTSGGSEPVWRPDGRAVYFRSYGKLFESLLSGGAPRLVFDGEAEPGTFDAAGYDVIGNDARFLMIASHSPGAAPSELHVVLNWRSVDPSSPSPSSAAREGPPPR